MFEVYHVLLPFGDGSNSEFLHRELLGMRAGSKSHQLPNGGFVFYVGEATEPQLIEAAAKLIAEDEEHRGGYGF